MSSGRRKKSFKRILKHKIFRTRNIFSLFGIIFSSIVLIYLLLLNIIPSSYYILIVLFVLIFNIIGIAFINAHRKKVLKIVGSVMIGFVILFNLFGLYYIVNIDNYLNEKFSYKDSYFKQTHYVLSRKESNYVESDIRGNIGIFQESSHSDEAFSKLSSQFSVKRNNYSNLSLMFQDFSKGVVDFLLMDQASYDVFFSLSKDYQKNDYSILHEFDLFSKIENHANSVKDSFQIFVGLKNSSGIIEYAMILSVNQLNKKILITYLPNDYYLPVYGRDSIQDSLLYLNLYDDNCLIDSLEELLNVSIDYSVIFDVDHFSKLIDYLGGITFCSDYEYTTTYSSYRNISKEGEKDFVGKECKLIHGKEALAISREVKAFPEGEKNRGNNCRQIVESTLKKFFQFKVLSHFNETLNLSKDFFDTNISRDTFIDLVKNLFFYKNSWSSSYQILTGTPSKALVYHSNLEDQVILSNESNVLTASENMKNVMNLQ
ncbi:MAG: LCP family protein [Bacilli bacterium]|nr:LCP family protein [Bacilli bacterium]